MAVLLVLTHLSQVLTHQFDLLDQIANHVDFGPDPFPGQLALHMAYKLLMLLLQELHLALERHQG